MRVAYGWKRLYSGHAAKPIVSAAWSWPISGIKAGLRNPEQRRPRDFNPRRKFSCPVWPISEPHAHPSREPRVPYSSDFLEHRSVTILCWWQSHKYVSNGGWRQEEHDRFWCEVHLLQRRRHWRPNWLDYARPAETDSEAAKDAKSQYDLAGGRLPA